MATRHCTECGVDIMTNTIYDRVDDIFRSFISNNRKWIDTMEKGDIIQMPDRSRGDAMKVPIGSSHYDLCSLDLLEYPFDVKYVGVVEWGEGDMIIFLDEGMNKIFEYYDVM